MDGKGVIVSITLLLHPVLLLFCAILIHICVCIYKVCQQLKECQTKFGKEFIAGIVVGTL